jgi:hypothetical protein
VTSRQAPTQSDLLAIWERGERARPGRRALALLAGAVPDAGEDELARLPIGRRDRALLALREELFGSNFTGITSCPACGEEIALTFDAAEVQREAAKAETAAVHADGFAIELRLPTGSDAAAIESASDLASARAALFARCIVSAERDGEPVDAAALPAEVAEAVVARMAELDPQGDVALDVDCPSCTHAWREPFDIVTFLWTELAAWARRLLSDVHALAWAYGWSEREILALSPARRDFYLERVQ